MLQKLPLTDTAIRICLLEAYHLEAHEITFMPLGADPNASVYRITGGDGRIYFLKAIRGHVAETALVVPHLLYAQGISQIIAPIASKANHLWTPCDAFQLILYPFVQGQNGFARAFSEAQWVDFGRALRGVHSVTLPNTLRHQLPHEQYSSEWRDKVRGFVEMVKRDAFDDPQAHEAAALIREQEAVIRDLVNTAERLGNQLGATNLPFVLCHSDLHAGNVLLEESGAFYMVDWDAPILAPKERDLMFIGNGIGGVWKTPIEAEWFYAGYGAVEVNPIALAYYRCERIVQDIAVGCESLLLTTEGGDNRAQELYFLKLQFLPDDVLAIAQRSAHNLPT